MAIPDSALEELRSARDRRAYARIGWTLLGGLVLSIGVMIVGIVSVAAEGGHAASQVLPIDKVAGSVVQGKPSAILDLGILLLFATPLAGVLVALVEFVRQGDRPFVLITGLLLLILVIGFAAALH